MTGDDPIERARNIGSVDDARQLYCEWADRYDADVFETSGVTGSRRIAELAAEHVTDRATPVVDLGCGTGAVGQHLADLGFDTIIGLDLSPEMLAIAERTGAYDRLVEADLNEPPTLGRTFGAAVSAGTFTTGHVGAAAVPGLLALLRPGSWLFWTVAPTLWPTFETALLDSGITVLGSTAEAIRRDSDDRSHMVVGRLAADSGS